jgi:CRISPR-associated protein Cmr2
MNDSLLLFTFSPVQPFIAEARRAADLYTGSQILVELAKAAAEAIGTSRLIYPAQDENGKLPQDIPNKLVARVPWEDCETIADKARQALLKHWKKLAEEARAAFEKEAGLPFDHSIWDRQTADVYLWEIYWSAVLLPAEDQYKPAYAEAEAALNATKYTRQFIQPSMQKPNGEKVFGESGFKDTLSGKRESLHAEGQSGSEYWFQVGRVEQITPIKIRPSMGDNTETGRPRERLDALGVIKRFHPKLSEKGVAPFRGFPSTSSIASLDYLTRAQKLAEAKLREHAEAVFSLLGKKEKYYVRDEKEIWRFDGDLLYPETFTAKRFERDYGIENVERLLLNKARGTLSELIAHKVTATDKLGGPSPYYAIIKLDGDDMGKHIRACNTKDEHKRFSEKLSEFAAKVKELANDPQYHACVIYNGGDDVLAIASLRKAIEFAKAMADKFNEIMEKKATASAGIVITHHLSPLSNALRQVQKAEEKAKEQDGKNAVCVTVLRRSGETLQMVSKWDQMDKFAAFVDLFAKDELASKLPYDIAQASYALPSADEKSKAEISRLIKRHSAPKIAESDEAKRQELKKQWIIDRATELYLWAVSLPPEFQEREYQIEGLANWLSLARFVSQGGRT